MYGKDFRCLNTKGKYGKVTNTEIKWLIISKSVMIIIFVEFIDQLIDYPINCASLSPQLQRNGLNAWSLYKIYKVVTYVDSDEV